MEDVNKKKATTIRAYCYYLLKAIVYSKTSCFFITILNYKNLQYIIKLFWFFEKSQLKINLLKLIHIKI